MGVIAEEIEREKDRLPRGWGRFGKALEQLAEICGPGESLLSSCVTLNPQFRHTSSTMGGALLEMTDATNVVLAATSKRLIVISTGMSGTPRKHYDLSWNGLQIAERKKNEFTLRAEGRRDPVPGRRQAAGGGLPRRRRGKGRLALATAGRPWAAAGPIGSENGIPRCRTAAPVGPAL